MFEGDWNPYDVLINLSERMRHLEQAHNRLAEAFQRTENEFNQLLKAFQNLQKSHLALSELVGAAAISKFDIKQHELRR